MKRIIFLLVLSVFFVSQSKAYLLTVTSGHTYKFYNNLDLNFARFVLKTAVISADCYGYASITVYLDNNEQIVRALRGQAQGGVGDRTLSGTIHTPGKSRATRIKLAVSGETRKVKTDDNSYTFYVAWGSAEVTWDS